MEWAVAALLKSYGVHGNYGGPQPYYLAAGFTLAGGDMVEDTDAAAKRRESRAQLLTPAAGVIK